MHDTQLERAGHRCALGGRAGEQQAAAAALRKKKRGGRRQGFFVKNGDGAAPPTTDTYSLSQGQDEFYFGLPYREMDLVLWALNHGIAKEHPTEALKISPERAGRVYDDIRAKRRVTQYLHRQSVLLGPVPEIDGE